MSRPLQILLVEDNPNDAELVLRELRRSGCAHEARRVDNEKDFLAALQAGPDIVLSDFDMPQFNGLRALQLLQDSGLDIPFILISGTIGEETAVEAMKRGASDYLLKDRLARLGPAIEHALEQDSLRRERHRAEQGLRLFRALVDHSDDAFEVLDPKTGRFLDVNDTGCARLGYSREEYLRLHVSDVDVTIVVDRWEAMTERLRRAGSLSDEGVHRRKDGSTFPVEVKLQWVRLDRDYIVAAVRDISERREAEATLRESEVRFRQIAENIQEVFWMADPENRTLLYVSPAFETVWGRRCADVREYPSDWLRTIHPDDRARVAAATERQSEGNYHEVYRVMRPDGTIRWVRDRAYPIRDAQGRVCRLVGTAEDITENRTLEEQFLQAQKMEAIGTLAGGIAHDFNNILAAIMGYTELVKMQITDQPKVEGYLAALLKASERATALVRQILAFSRQDKHERRPVHLEKVVEEPLALLRATLPATIAFEVEQAESLPSVLADATQIHQILMNLGTNAAHAMKDRTGRLGVRLELQEITPEFARTTTRLHPGPYVCLSVSDTGKGMPREVLERIFEPFFTTKGPGEGTGLGLAVVHGVMQSHGGDIAVQSVPGEGTTFRLYFPVHTLPAEPGADETVGELPRGGGERVLFVDDEAPIMVVGRLMLEELGYQVEGGTDVEEMLERVRSAPDAFDLIVTDLTMPGMTGVEFLRRLLEIRPGLPVILTTGYNATLTPERARELGARELLMKPLSLHRLGTAVKRALAPAEDTHTPSIHA